MNRYQCGGITERLEVRFLLETDGCLVLVERVPADVCTLCGEETCCGRRGKAGAHAREIEAGKLAIKSVNDVRATVYS